VNLFEKLKGYEHTFTAWVAKQYAKLYAEEPKIEKVADTVLPYAIKATQLIVAAEVGGPAAAEIGEVADEAVRDLHVAGALIHDFGPNPTAASTIAGVVDNLYGLLTAGHVKNAASVSSVQKIVNTLGALTAALPAPAPSPAPAP
jgi:hypothetical protein